MVLVVSNGNSTTMAMVLVGFQSNGIGSVMVQVMSWSGDWHSYYLWTPETVSVISHISAPFRVQPLLKAKHVGHCVFNIFK